MSHITTRTRLIAALIGGALIASILFMADVLRQPHDMPEIQGALMQTPRQLPDFRLTDHHGEPFTRENLKGQWHMVSYGFTHCPDICPVTLGVKAQVLKRLKERGSYEDLGLLFYSVDPERDTPERLSEYVTYFHPEMVGLTVTGAPEENHKPFEEGLGIIHDIPEDQGDEDYLVNHGVMIYLLNPDGNLRAILEPDVEEDGRLSFSAEKLVSDYLAIRNYLDE